MVREGEASWQVERGQYLLGFEVSESKMACCAWSEHKPQSETPAPATATAAGDAPRTTGLRRHSQLESTDPRGALAA